MLKAHDVMRLYLAFLLETGQVAVQNELPVTLALVLVNYRDPLLSWLLDPGSLILVALLDTAWLWPLYLVIFVQSHSLVILGKVHVAVSTIVVN